MLAKEPQGFIAINQKVVVHWERRELLGARLAEAATLLLRGIDDERRARGVAASLAHASRHGVVSCKNVNKQSTLPELEPNVFV